MKKSVAQEAIYDGLYRQMEVDLLRPDLPTPLMAYLVSRSVLPTSSTLLDIGCGIGEDVRLAVTKHGFRQATGIDPSVTAIKYAESITNARVSAPDRKRIKFLTGHIEDKNLNLGIYDIVTATSVIHLMNPESAGEFIKAAAAHTRPGGILTIATKTSRSLDARSINEGGISKQLLEKGSGYELHLSDDGLERYYYTPERVRKMVAAATGRGVKTDILVTTYDFKRPIKDCEFVVAIAR